MRRVPRRWSTSFGRWVRRRGVTRLATELQTAGHPVTSDAIYKWVAGRHTPREQHARVIAKLSRGRLSLEQIMFRQRDLARTSALNRSSATPGAELSILGD